MTISHKGFTDAMSLELKDTRADSIVSNASAAHPSAFAGVSLTSGDQRATLDCIIFKGAANE